MTKPRTPSSIEDALDQACGFVGARVVAGWLGKSESLVRKMADPDNSANRLHLDDALAIDRRLAAAGFPQVFGDLVASLAESNERTAPPADQVAARSLAHAVRVVGEAANLLQSVQAAELDGLVDRDEAGRLCADLERLQKAIAPLRLALVQLGARIGAPLARRRA